MGRLPYFMKTWKALGASKQIIFWIKGFKIPFNSVPQQRVFANNQFSDAEKLKLEQEISLLINLGAVKSCVPVEGQFLSPYFLVNKPNGEKRFVLNLKELNKYLDPPHFKMEDGRTVCKLLEKKLLFN